MDDVNAKASSRLALIAERAGITSTTPLASIDGGKWANPKFMTGTPK